MQDTEMPEAFCAVATSGVPRHGININIAKPGSISDR
jgi:hypothetical protein